MRVSTRRLSNRDREAALDYLRGDARSNLVLLDLVAGMGASSSAGEVTPEMVGAWAESELVGLASVRPSVSLDAQMGQDALMALLPHVESVSTGLLKSARRVVDPIWDELARQRRSLLDRIEIAYAIDSLQSLGNCGPPRGARLRRARTGDLGPLVMAARASLREESRPDPFTGDPVGFQRWVRSRTHRARVVEFEGQVVFVAYADVRRPEGWLIQGVYTWPHMRRRGFAAAGMAALVREALGAGTDHVQLAVVERNAAATGLYEGLGFRRFGELRTILFV
jgi:ribosomal protein S18 acetylase RimI-like enzyme